MSKERAIARQRQLKATRYMQQLRREAMASITHLISTDGAFSMTAWTELGHRAGLNPPSPDTVRVIVARMRRLYAQANQGRD